MFCFCLEIQGHMKCYRYIYMYLTKERSLTIWLSRLYLIYNDPVTVKSNQISLHNLEEKRDQLSEGIHHENGHTWQILKKKITIHKERSLLFKMENIGKNILKVFVFYM